MRPDAKAILCMPAVAARLHLVPDDDESAWAGEDMRTNLLATIRVPHMFGYGGKANINLPVRNIHGTHIGTLPPYMWLMVTLAGSCVS
jgi:hypothetical protein